MSPQMPPWIMLTAVVAGIALCVVTEIVQGIPPRLVMRHLRDFVIDATTFVLILVAFAVVVFTPILLILRHS